jgi:FKBP-type peptidyl-prolyl cis-trans isomerase FkpA
MRSLFLPRFALATSLLFAASAFAAPAESGLPANMTEDEKTIYALGFMMYQRSVAPFDLNASELAILQKAFADAAGGETAAVKTEEYEAKIRAFAQARGAKRAENEKAKGQAYVTEAAKKPGAVKTQSGMIYTETAAGTGASPTSADKVKVHYRGTLIDGSEFDSSHKRGQPIEFSLGQVIGCWTEGLQKMKVGGKATLVCPSDLAYGDRGRPGILPGATLIFDVELIDIVKVEPPAATPPPTQ